jgi:hypothetical protein
MIANHEFPPVSLLFRTLARRCVCSYWFTLFSRSLQCPASSLDASSNVRHLICIFFDVNFAFNFSSFCILHFPFFYLSSRRFLSFNAPNPRSRAPS